MEVKNSGVALYPIAIIIIGSKTTINLEEFDDLLRKMVEFRVTYDECRNITEEVKEEVILGEGEEYGIAAFAEDYPTEEEQAYEAERIARAEERLRNEYI